jgi:hypothetical protein
MDTSFDNHPPAPDAILELIKDALVGCRESSGRLCGFVRGLEIGILTLQDSQSTDNDSIDRLKERSFRLSEFHVDYHLGVALGINLATEVASAMFSCKWPRSCDSFHRNLKESR